MIRSFIYAVIFTVTTIYLIEGIFWTWNPFVSEIPTWFAIPVSFLIGFCYGTFFYLRAMND